MPPLRKHLNPEKQALPAEPDARGVRQNNAHAKSYIKPLPYADYSPEMLDLVEMCGGKGSPLMAAFRRESWFGIQKHTRPQLLAFLRRKARSTNVLLGDAARGVLEKLSPLPKSTNNIAFPTDD
jgi:hypothetical protein